MSPFAVLKQIEVGISATMVDIMALKLYIFSNFAAIFLYFFVIVLKSSIGVFCQVIVAIKWTAPVFVELLFKCCVRYRCSIGF